MINAATGTGRPKKTKPELLKVFAAGFEPSVRESMPAEYQRTLNLGEEILTQIDEHWQAFCASPEVSPAYTVDVYKLHPSYKPEKYLPEWYAILKSVIMNRYVGAEFRGAESFFQVVFR